MLAVPLAVAVVLALWALAISPVTSAEPPAPVISEVLSATPDAAITTTATLIEAPSVPIRSSSSGLVTRVLVEGGVPVGQGDVLLEVDGASVVAYLAETPLHRDLEPGASGADVAVAERLLVDLGYLDVADESLDQGAAEAIRTFNDDHGWGQGSTLVLHSLVWIPRWVGPPEVVLVEPGERIEPQTELYSAPDGADAIAVDIERAPTDRTVTVGTASVLLAAGEDEIHDAGAVAALAEVMGDETSVIASVTLREPSTVGAVPASAIVADDRGSFCYFPDVTGSPISVTVTTGRTGVVYIDASQIGSPVLVNPRETRAELACG
ncbi:biotin/lipoyl-binding protein [Salana multivorans]|uniref:biotin/lipoyl-binding protein n=1 Tax=Salana multivorans TaxID=120377 RepID=UPI001472D4B4|nr:biotin/lipoyl-binding protein [Salana multivorans]